MIWKVTRTPKMKFLPFWSGAGGRKTSASAPGGGPPSPPHIANYENRGIFRNHQKFWGISSRDLVFVIPVNRIFIIARPEKRPRALQGEDPTLPPHIVDLLDLMDLLDLLDLTDPKHSSSRPGWDRTCCKNKGM